ncbi:uncharacterized protein EDB91DRAFT_504662 [Suillus paluster]|uniref:uncharacterized protein n=1 Tax=Suillus paluster TaxID=48578 RepID=UPI001B882A73|nr:uncharacterized protein EDB91DRAFT_504662 [Suillus paluster]KAG1736405.1 hypothetical protein EDB91DRAFT_504662 [Suillus paluster]
MNELHNRRNIWQLYIPPYLSLKDKERFDILSQEQPPADIKSWNSLAELHMRRRLFEPLCDACHHFVSDVLHRCIDCERNDYDLCVECESLPVSEHQYPSDHKSTHNMLVFRMSLPHSCYYRVQWHARNYLSAYMSNAPPPEGPSTVQEDESRIQSNETELPPSTEVTQTDVSCAPLDSPADDEELSGDSEAASGGIVEVETSVADGEAYTCAECGVEMKGIFYVCLTCGEIQTVHCLMWRLCVPRCIQCGHSTSTLTNTGWSRLKTLLKTQVEHQTNLPMTRTRQVRFPYESTSWLQWWNLALLSRIAALMHLSRRLIYSCVV